VLFIAVLTGVCSLINYFLWSSYELPDVLKIVSIAVQIILTAVTVIAAVQYRGRRLRMSFDTAGYKIFTFPFALIFLSIVGNTAVLTVLFLRMTGVIQNL
jgi:hypothetical protein